MLSLAVSTLQPPLLAVGEILVAYRHAEAQSPSSEVLHGRCQGAEFLGPGPPIADLINRGSLSMRTRFHLGRPEATQVIGYCPALPNTRRQADGPPRAISCLMRWTVPLPTPTAFATLMMPCPLDNSARTHCWCGPLALLMDNAARGGARSTLLLPRDG